ncbi:SaoD/DsrE family protein [Halobellus clavatus]|uniref:Sulfur relay (Sulfurtransferase) complex TusBCD TusD component, DsrE family n=1 Tax=Halobellus clavatus TaxID=660517 RepID=A0A1H3H6Y3_9EURY|nr:SaoD/DsrE family protein [Halobellus clavatus]SDY11177.1 Sulfur relay (sulfurtransferase) complex TusBCD TusD component, DsrE family [Halobellus clavatus]
MKVAYVFATAGQTIDYVLGEMILPQLESGTHGAEVVGMFFFHDNTYALREGDPIGERLADVASDQELLLMLCDQCAKKRGLAASDHTDDAGREHFEATNTVEPATVGCFPDLYAALGDVGVDQVITL